MAEKGRDANIIALEAVHAALKDLDAASRKKVLSSVFALLELDAPPLLGPSPQTPLTGERPATSAPNRPISLVELVNDKSPGTNAQRIALFAYYREKSEAISRFS